MGFLLAIEGADGAGKGTAAAAVVEGLRAAGRSAALVSFPRYTNTVGGWALGRFLAGELPRDTGPEAAAVLYALDRRESLPMLQAEMARNDVIVFDRYIASNIAYQAAKVDDDAAATLMGWIRDLELVQFALPPPDLSIYLDAPLEVSRRLIAQKHRRSYTARTYDEHEADTLLQARVRARYAALAATDLIGAWRTVPLMAGDALRTPAEIAAEIVAATLGALAA